jgi:hypothetical protein
MKLAYCPKAIRNSNKLLDLGTKFFLASYFKVLTADYIYCLLYIWIGCLN